MIGIPYLYKYFPNKLRKKISKFSGRIRAIQAAMGSTHRSKQYIGRTMNQNTVDKKINIFEVSFMFFYSLSIRLPVIFFSVDFKRDFKLLGF